LSVAAILLGSCSGQALQPAPPLSSAASFSYSQSARGSNQETPSASRARRSAVPLLYVNYTGSNAIEVYEQAGKHQKPVGSIVSSTLTNILALNTDRDGNLYVADCGNSGGSAIRSTIQVFPPGSQSPSFMYDNTIGCASDIAVGRDKVVVSNLEDVGYGVVAATVFRRNVAMPWYTLTATTGGSGALGVALDAEGNCYLSSDGDDSSGGWISEFRRCAQGAWPDTFAIQNAQFVWEVRVDRAGDVVVANWPEIDYFHAGSNGVPFKRLRNRGMSFSFASNDSHLWTTDSANINVIENVRTSDDRVLDKIHTPKQYVGSLAAWPPD
jgi:hypothetical protein